jgi:hypothetical protein
MISQKLKTIFIISIPVFIAHGLEEFFNNFYNVDWSTKLVFGFLSEMSVPQATFLVFQIMLWLALIVFAFLIANEKWRLRLMLLPGIIFIVELHHPWSVIESLGYYPGVITSIPLLILGFLFWKELLNNFKSK